MKNTIDDGKGERLVDTDIAAMRRFLQDYPKKMVDLDVLQAAFASWDYDRFRPAVAALLDDGSLTAVRTGGVDFSGLPRRAYGRRAENSHRYGVARWPPADGGCTGPQYRNGVAGYGRY